MTARPAVSQAKRQAGAEHRVPEGTILAVRRRPVAVGQVLPTLPLALTAALSVPIDLEHTYMEAARRVYLT